MIQGNSSDPRGLKASYGYSKHDSNTPACPTQASNPLPVRWRRLRQANGTVYSAVAAHTARPRTPSHDGQCTGATA